LQKAIQITLVAVEKPDVDITLKITNDEEMHQLNWTYRSIDKATDVLSFNQDYIDPETDRYYLGDIIISFDQAQAQAEENQQSLIEEFARLAIHGTLHLLGHDHAEPEEKNVMWDLQENLVNQVMDSLLGG
jgi:probable rRNA maturation factor